MDSMTNSTSDYYDYSNWTDPNISVDDSSQSRRLHIPDVIALVTGTMMFFSHKTNFKSVSSLDALCVSVAYINCCINPIIYVVAAQGFHTRFLKSLPSRIRGVLAEESVGRDSKSNTCSTVDTPALKSQEV